VKPTFTKIGLDSNSAPSSSKISARGSGHRRTVSNMEKFDSSRSILASIQVRVDDFQKRSDVPTSESETTPGQSNSSKNRILSEMTELREFVDDQETQTSFFSEQIEQLSNIIAEKDKEISALKSEVFFAEISTTYL